MNYFQPLEKFKTMQYINNWRGRYEKKYFKKYNFNGLVLAVIIGIILGIQFMTGSVEQKAKVKDALVPYIAGCIIIFGAFGIWKLVVTILRGI